MGRLLWRVQGGLLSQIEGLGISGEGSVGARHEAAVVSPSPCRVSSFATPSAVQRKRDGSAGLQRVGARDAGREVGQAEGMAALSVRRSS